MWRSTCIFVVVLASAAALAQDAPPLLPTTSPSTQPFVVDNLPADSPIRTWFTELASPDAAVRDKAQTQLMGISRNELGGLRELIADNRPLATAQIAALHDIVTHVFLATETYPLAPDGKSFLGVRWQPADNFSSGPLSLGVTVEERLPGFPGFQLLREGDMIMGVIISPDTPMEQLRPTPDPMSLQGAVGNAPPNQSILLLVLRQGQRMRISLKLAPKPADLSRDPGDPIIENFLAGRLQRAEQFWQDQFAPLLRQSVS
jgi:hypothetical protein